MWHIIDEQETVQNLKNLTNAKCGKTYFKFWTYVNSNIQLYQLFDGQLVNEVVVFWVKIKTKLKNITFLPCMIFILVKLKTLTSNNKRRFFGFLCSNQ